MPVEAFRRCRRTGRCPGRGTDAEVAGAGGAVGICSGAADPAGNPVVAPSIGPLSPAASRATEIVRWMTLPTAAPGPGEASGPAPGGRIGRAAGLSPGSGVTLDAEAIVGASVVGASVVAASEDSRRWSERRCRGREPQRALIGPGSVRQLTVPAALPCAAPRPEPGRAARAPPRAAQSAVARCPESGAGPAAGTIRRTTGPAGVGMARVFPSAAGLVVRWTPTALAGADDTSDCRVCGFGSAAGPMGRQRTVRRSGLSRPVRAAQPVGLFPHRAAPFRLGHRPRCCAALRGCRRSWSARLQEPLRGEAGRLRRRAHPAVACRAVPPGRAREALPWTVARLVGRARRKSPRHRDRDPDILDFGHGSRRLAPSGRRPACLPGFLQSSVVQDVRVRHG